LNQYIECVATLGISNSAILDLAPEIETAANTLAAVGLAISEGKAGLDRLGCCFGLWLGRQYNSNSATTAAATTTAVTNILVIQ